MATATESELYLGVTRGLSIAESEPYLSLVETRGIWVVMCS